MDAVAAGNQRPMIRYPKQDLSVNMRVWNNVQLTAIGRLLELEAARLEAGAQGSPARMDPFDPARPLQIKRIRDESGGAFLLLYSVGPDLADDGGRIEYDVSKGLASPGDITLRVPLADMPIQPIRTVR